MTHPIHADILRHALEALNKTIHEAIGHLIHGDHLAVLGAMVHFEDQAADVKAAVRLYSNELRDRRFK